MPQLLLSHLLPSIRRSRVASAAFALALLALSVDGAPAQTVTVLYEFNGTAGANPSDAPVQGRDGQLYGITVTGGKHNVGAVYRMNTAGKASVLHSFNGADGSFPYGRLTLGTDGNFYGTTSDGGSAGYGVLFKMTPTGTLTILHNFNTDGADGTVPGSGPVLASDGNFYGTTETGGANGAGTLYKLTPAGVYTLIYSLDPTVGWGVVGAPLQGIDSYLYIAAWEGGSNKCGSLMKVSTSGVLNNSYSFDCGVNGANPEGSLIEASDGNIYGSTHGGGAYASGVLFKLSPSFAYTVLHSFGSTQAEGANPSGGVMQATDSNLYGLNTNGGNFGYGTVYISVLSGTSNTVYNWANLVFPQGQLTQHSGGPLYGVTYDSPRSTLGCVYRLNAEIGPFVALVLSQGKAGSTTQILGQGLTGITSVTFNGVPASSFRVVTDTYMTAVVPARATSGPVVVTTPAGTMKSNKNFVVLK